MPARSRNAGCVSTSCHDMFVYLESDFICFLLPASQPANALPFNDLYQKYFALCLQSRAFLAEGLFFISVRSLCKQYKGVCFRINYIESCQVTEAFFLIITNFDKKTLRKKILLAL